MRRLFAWRWLGLLALVAAAAVASAEERALDFIHALEENDYSDIAVQYMHAMQDQQASLPEAIRDVWDLELCKALQGASKQAYNAKEAEELIDEAEAALNRFLKAKPNHPEAATAHISWGMVVEERALQHLRAAEMLAEKAAADKDKAAQRDEHHAAARKGLEDARLHFKQGLTLIVQQLQAGPAGAEAGTRGSREQKAALARRLRLTTEAINARFQMALADYYAAQTYSDPKSPERSAALRKAAKGFDLIWQNNRVDENNQVSLVGLYSHMWHGKTAEELGELQDAKDIYDEVLASVPDPNQIAANMNGMEGLFAQVQYFRFLILKKQNPADFIPEVADWLAKYGRLFRQTDGYQGTKLELARAEFQAAEKAKGAEADRYLRDAKTQLTDMSKVRSQYQQQAIVLMREKTQAGAVNFAEMTNFDAVIALADVAMQANNWSEALAGYQRAAEIGQKLNNPKDRDRLRKVIEQVGVARLMLAADLLAQDKLPEALAAAKQVRDQYREGPLGPKAGLLAVQVAARILAGAADQSQKLAALKQLEDLGHECVEAWPGKPETDEVRLFLGQAKNYRGDIDAALKIYEDVNPKSERYAMGLFYAGRTYWQLYLRQKNDPKAKAKAAEYRGLAQKRLTDSLELQRKTAESNKPLASQQIETQLILGEMALESNDSAQAIKLLAPLVKELEVNKPETFDNVTMRVFIGAVRAYVAAGQIENAGNVGKVLLESGPDVRAVNVALLEFVRAVENECKEADGRVIRLKSENKADEAAQAQAKAEQVKQLQGQVIRKLAARKDLGAGGMIYVADACVTIGLDDEAEKQYLAIEKQYEEDPKFKETAEKAMTRVYAQMAGILRRKKKYDEAQEAINKLINAYPHALEPRMEHARVSQSRAEEDATRWDDAAQEWTKLRNLLSSARKKPPEYYEATYDMAYCTVYAANELAKSGRKDEAVKRIREVEKALIVAIVLNAKLSGPDMIERYNALLQQIAPITGSKFQPAGAPAAAQPDAKPATP